MKTRMHEILGVEPFEKFQVVGGYEGRNYFLDGYGWMRWGDSDWESDIEDVYNAVNNGIIRKPRLTAEQLYALEALYRFFDARWIACDSDGLAYIFNEKPTKSTRTWCGMLANNLYHAKVCKMFAPLVSWADPEPLDIVKTLRDNGIEVEG